MPDIHFDEIIRSSGRWLLYGGRMLSSVPATVTFTPSESDTDPLDFAVQMKIDIVDGRLSCVSLTAKRLADGPPITSEGTPATWYRRTNRERSPERARRAAR